MGSQYAARLGVLLAIDTAEFSAGINEAIASNKKLKRAIESDMQAAAKEIQRLKYAVEDYGKEVTHVTQMERALAEGGRYARLAKVKDSEAIVQGMLQQAAALDKLAAADKKLGSGANTSGMDRYLKQALAYQTTDIVTSLAGGQNPLMVLLQQGGQLRDQFGGFKPLFAGIAQAVTLSKVAFVGVGAAIAGVAYAAYQGSQEFAKLRDDMILTNNYAGITTSSFDKMSASLSDKLNMAVGDTKDIFGALVASGTVTRANLEVIATTIGKVSQLSGEAADTVAQRLLPSFDGTASSAAKLNNTFHFLNLAQYKQIELLEKQGKKQEAAKLTAELLNKSLEEQTRNLGYLEKGWIGVTNGLSSFWNKLKDIGKDDTTEQALRKIDDKIKSLQGDNVFGESKTARDQRLADAVAERKKILEKQAEENKKAADKEKLAKDKADIERYSGAGGLSKAMDIEANIRKQAIDKAYQDSLFNANEMEKVDIESARRIAEKTLEIEKQNSEEKFAFSSQRYRELGAFVLMEESKAAQEKQKINRDTYLAYEKKQISEKDSLDMEKQRMGIYQSNFFITEQEAKLAERKLETQQKIAEIVRDLNNGKLGSDAAAKLIEEQETIGKTKDMLINLGERLQYLKDINQAVFQSMTQAIQAFLITGKFSFKNFTAALVANILQIQAQWFALSMMKGFGSVFGGMNVGTAMNYGTNVGSQQTAMLAAQDAGIGAFASGGTITGPAIVGENGPELFIPSGSGTIVPNQRMGDYGGGSTNITNNYIQAIDTKSFEDRLYGSNKAIWAANQYADKNIATSRSRT